MSELFFRAEFGVFEEEDFGAVVVEVDDGFEFGEFAGDFFDQAGAEAVVFDAFTLV